MGISQIARNWCVGSGFKLDPYSPTLSIQIRIRIRIHTGKNRINMRQEMQAWKQKFTVQRFNGQKISSGVITFFIAKKTHFQWKAFSHHCKTFFSKLITSLGPYPIWAKILDPNPNLDPLITLHHERRRKLFRTDMWATFFGRKSHQLVKIMMILTFFSYFC